MAELILPQVHIDLKQAVGLTPVEQRFHLLSLTLLSLMKPTTVVSSENLMICLVVNLTQQFWVIVYHLSESVKASVINVFHCSTPERGRSFLCHISAFHQGFSNDTHKYTYT